MINHRLIYLKSVKDVLKFDWRIRTKFPRKTLLDDYFKGLEKKMVENFLKSDQEKVIYHNSNNFITGPEAKKYVEKNECFMRDHYAVELKAIPKSKEVGPFVHFDKTKKYFESKIKNKEKIEIKYLEEIIKDFIFLKIKIFIILNFFFCFNYM